MKNPYESENRTRALDGAWVPMENGILASIDLKTRKLETEKI